MSPAASTTLLATIAYGVTGVCLFLALRSRPKQLKQQAGYAEGNTEHAPELGEQPGDWADSIGADPIEPDGPRYGDPHEDPAVHRSQPPRRTFQPEQPELDHERDEQHGDDLRDYRALVRIEFHVPKGTALTVRLSAESNT